MEVELSRFRVKTGLAAKVDEWMTFLNENLPAVLETLEGEKMCVESIFRQTVGPEEYLYWYSVRGDDGSRIEESVHWLDKRHLEYWKACIDPDYERQDLALQAHFVPDRIRALMPD